MIDLDLDRSRHPSPVILSCRVAPMIAIIILPVVRYPNLKVFHSVSSFFCLDQTERPWRPLPWRPLPWRPLPCPPASAPGTVPRAMISNHSPMGSPNFERPLCGRGGTVPSLADRTAVAAGFTTEYSPGTIPTVDRGRTGSGGRTIRAVRGLGRVGTPHGHMVRRRERRKVRTTGEREWVPTPRPPRLFGTEGSSDRRSVVLPLLLLGILAVTDWTAGRGDGLRATNCPGDELQIGRLERGEEGARERSNIRYVRIGPSPSPPPSRSTFRGRP